MITSFRIQNLRSIKDSGFIELKPVNILLGANSTGKSTFLRSFPLFTQSVNKKLRGPVSWFDMSSVDFGDYKTARNKRATPTEGIRFSYRIEKMTGRRYYRPTGFQLGDVDPDEFQNCTVEIGLDGTRDETYVKDIIITLQNISFHLSVKTKNDNVLIAVNDEEVNIPNQIRFNYNTDGGILPTIIPSKQDDIGSISFLQQLIDNSIKILLARCSGRLKNYVRLESVLRATTFNKEKFLKRTKTITSLKSFNDSVANWTLKTPEFNKLYSLYVLQKIPFVFDMINVEFSQFYKQCSYVAPMRAEANRYTRLQGLQVDEVDAFGKNMVEFVASQNNKAKQSLDNYLKDLLGITIDVSDDSGQKTLHVRKGDEDFSIADVGFGYSQILPIATKMWHTQYLKQNDDLYGIYRFKTVQRSMILIEQPELHLHPIMQAQIADGFLKTILKAKENDYTLKYIIETHSQTIISRIGRRIREGRISPDDVNVLLFEKDKKTKDTIIKKAVFNEKGQLKNWPFGFFDPDDDKF